MDIRTSAMFLSLVLVVKPQENNGCIEVLDIQFDNCLEI